MKKHRHWYLALIFTFILGVHDGNIALWRSGKLEPLRVFPYRAETLPEEIRDALEEGISFSSVQELEKIAENYLS